MLAAEEEKIAEEMQADLLAGTLELDPENDPVLGTTENGIEIKFHNVSTTTLTGNWDYAAFTKNYFLGNSIASGTFYNLSGYLYITLGGYNWIIIGRNSNLTTMSLTNTYNQGTATATEFIKFASYNTYANTLNSQTETTTDAGSAINSANSKGLVNTIAGATRTYSYTLSSYGAPVAASEIPSGCVLCLSASTIGTSQYNPTGDSYYSYYPNSSLDTAMTNIYNKIKSAANNQIQSVTLQTYGFTAKNSGNSYKAIYNHSEHLFPLAGTYESLGTQSFAVKTYLDTNAKRDIDAKWWLRSGSSEYRYAQFINESGGIGGSLNILEAVDYYYGVRPAFVLKIT